MKGPNPPKTSADLFFWIAKLSAEAEWTADELSDALREAGVDPERFAALTLERVRRALRESPAHWRNRASRQREMLIAKVQAVPAQPRRDLTRDALIEKIKETLARLPSVVTQQLAMEWRGFQECSEEDLVSTLEELEIIEKLSQSEPGD
jgi:hypothetical protein